MTRWQTVVVKKLCRKCRNSQIEADKTNSGQLNDNFKGFSVDFLECTEHRYSSVQERFTDQYFVVTWMFSGLIHSFIKNKN